MPHTSCTVHSNGAMLEKASVDLRQLSDNCMHLPLQQYFKAHLHFSRFRCRGVFHSLYILRPQTTNVCTSFRRTRRIVRCACPSTRVHVLQPCSSTPRLVEPLAKCYRNNTSTPSRPPPLTTFFPNHSRKYKLSGTLDQDAIREYVTLGEKKYYQKR